MVNVSSRVAQEGKKKQLLNLAERKLYQKNELKLLFCNLCFFFFFWFEAGFRKNRYSVQLDVHYGTLKITLLTLPRYLN